MFTARARRARRCSPPSPTTSPRATPAPACAWATSTCTSATSTPARAFYVDLLGFEVMAGLPSALFLAAGGYHHHLGVNTWRGEGVGPAPAGTVGLREWTIVLEDEPLAALRARLAAAGLDGDAVADPWGIRVRLVAA